MLSLRQVSKCFPAGDGELEVLNEITFDVSPGESVAVVGPSGSGKSTLLNLAAGLDTPTSGTVELAAQRLVTLDDKALCDLRLNKVGFIFQQHHLLAQCTALENVLMPTLPLGGGEKYLCRAETLLEEVGLAGRRNHLPGQLSGGECSRVAFARALINKPDIIFADEPTGSLDNATAESMCDLLIKLKENYGTALVVVTHSREIGRRMGRQLALGRGRLAGQ